MTKGRKSMKLKLFLNRAYVYRYLVYLRHKYMVERYPKHEANRGYRSHFYKKIDFDNPKNLIEKIYWLLFNTDTSLWTHYADKFLVRDYVRKCGYESYLTKLYGKWENAKDIDFDKLPQKFILKTTNGCGSNIIVKNKNQFNIKKAKKRLNRWLSIPYGYSGAQIHYLKIKPCIIAEELLENTSEFSTSIVDYKIWCFHGVPECVLVVSNRSEKGYFLSSYDLEWNNISDISLRQPYLHNRKEEKPKSLEKMIEIAKNLSKNLPQVRVDFYDINGKPVFGEMTFTTGYGYYTEDYYLYLGSKINLDKTEVI
jgi:hypothetical protein